MFVYVYLFVYMREIVGGLGVWVSVYVIACICESLWVCLYLSVNIISVCVYVHINVQACFSSHAPMQNKYWQDI